MPRIPLSLYADNPMADARVEAVANPDYSRRQIAAAYAGVPSIDEREQRAQSQQANLAYRQGEAEAVRDQRATAAWAKTQQMAQQRAQKEAVRQQKAAGIALDAQNQPILDPQGSGVPLRRVGKVMLNEGSNAFAKNSATGAIEPTEVPGKLKNGRVIRDFGGGAKQDITNAPGGPEIIAGSEYGNARAQEAKQDRAAIAGEKTDISDQARVIAKNKATILGERHALGRQLNAYDRQIDALNKVGSGPIPPEIAALYKDPHPASEILADIKRKRDDLAKQWGAKEDAHMQAIYEDQALAQTKQSKDQQQAFRRETANAIIEGNRQVQKYLAEGNPMAAADALEALKNYRTDRLAKLKEMSQGPKAYADLSPEERKALREQAKQEATQEPGSEAWYQDEREAGAAVPTPENQTERLQRDVEAGTKALEESKAATEQAVQQVNAQLEPHQQQMQRIIAEDQQVVATGAPAKPRTLGDGSVVPMTDEGFDKLAQANREMQQTRAKLGAKIDDAQAAVDAHKQLAAQVGDKAAQLQEARTQEAVAQREALRQDPRTKGLADKLDALDTDTKQRLAEADQKYPEGPTREAARKTILDAHKTAIDEAEKSATADFIKPKLVGQQLLDLERTERSFSDAGGNQHVDIRVARPGTKGETDADMVSIDEARKEILRQSGMTPEQADAALRDAIGRQYRLDEKGSISFEPSAPAKGLEDALRDGLIDKQQADKLRPKLQEAQKYWDEVEKYAGGATKAKALLHGGLTAGTYMGAAEAGAAVGRSVPGPPMVKLAAGVASALAAGYLSQQAVKALSKYSDTLNELSASGALYPEYDTAGNLITFGAGIPSAVSNLGKLAGIAANQGGKRAALAAIAKVTGVGAGVGAATELAVRPAVEGAVAKVQESLGLHPDAVQMPSVKSVLTNAALGVLLAGHSVRFRDYSEADVASLMARAKVRQDAGLDPTAPISPEELQHQGFNDIGTVQQLSTPLSAAEATVWDSLKQQTARLQKTGAFDGMGVKFGGAKQAFIPVLGRDGEPLTSVGVRPEPVQPVAGEAAPETPPAQELPAPAPPDALDLKTLQAAAEADIAQLPAETQPMASGLVKIAQGRYHGPGGLTSSEIAALGYRVGKDGQLEDAKDKLNPAVGPIVNGHPIINQEAQEYLESIAPAAASMIGRDEATAREWAMQQPKPGEPQTEAPPATAKPEESAQTKAPDWIQATADEVLKRNKNRSKELSDLAAKGFSAKEIAGQMGLDVDDVNAMRVALGIPSRESPGLWSASGGQGGSKPGESQEFKKWRDAYLANQQRQELTPGPAASAEGVPPVESVQSQGAGAVEGVAPATPAAPAPTGGDLAPKRASDQLGERIKAAVRKASPEHVRQIMQHGSWLRDAIRAVEGKIPVELGKTGNDSGFSYDLAGKLVIDPAKAMAGIASLEKQTPGAGKDWVRQTIDHEVFHHITVRLHEADPEFAKDLDDLWSKLGEDFKALSAKAYFRDFKVKGWRNDTEGAFEFLRQLFENQEFRRLSEEYFAGNPGMLKRLKDLIRRFTEALTKLLRGEIQPELREPIARMLAKAKAALADLGKAETQESRTPDQQQKLNEVADVLQGQVEEMKAEGKTHNVKALEERIEKLRGAEKPTTEASAKPEESAQPAEAQPVTSDTRKDTPKSSTQLTFPPEEAKPIVAFGKTIPKEDLYESVDPEWSDGALETEPHVTALYGPTNHEPDPVAQVVAGHGPVTIRLGKMSLFKADDYDVLKIDVTSPELHDLNAKIKKLPNENKFPEYKPHVTIAYLKKGAGDKYVGDDRFEGKELTFNTMTFSPPKELRGEVGRPELPLTSSPEAQSLSPAIKTPAGDVIKGENHVAAYENAKKTIPDTSGSIEGFADDKGGFMTREEAAHKTGLPTNVEPGKLHSQDLPKGEELTKEQAVKPVTDVESLTSLLGAIDAGTVSADQVKQAYRDFRSNEPKIIAELAKWTKDKLLRYAGPNARASETKQALVRRALHRFEDGFNPTNVLSYGVGPNMGAERKAAMDRAVEQWTDEKIQSHAQSLRDVQAEQERAATNPQTLQEWKNFVWNKGRKGWTPEEEAQFRATPADKQRDWIRARGEKLLTPEELAKFDAVRGEERKAQEMRAKEQAATVAPAKVNTSTNIVETTHTRHGYPLFVVQMAERVEKAEYQKALEAAKKLGGWYSSFRGKGAAPGFQFKSRDNAEAFQKALAGETVDRSETVQAKEDQKTTTAATRLRESADKLDAAAGEILGRERKTNTAKRANEAARADANARAIKATAATMRNLAEAMASGEATHLDGVRARTHIDTLNALARAAKLNDERSRELSYSKQEELKNEPPTVGQMIHAEYPAPWLNKSDLVKLVEAGRNQPGAKLLADRVAKIRMNRNEGEAVALNDPEAIEYVRELMQKVQERGKPVYDIYKWKFDTYDRLQAMGIKDVATLRAALREFLQYREGAQAENPVKRLERELIGRKIEGFFPTPRPVIDEMLQRAGVGPGMKVLEPSAGKGDIVEAAQARGATVEAIEPQTTLRAILEAKGIKTIGSDFMDVAAKPEYDAVVMNPPFERGQDAEHVMRALDFVKPGGTVVAVMSEGPFFRSDKKSLEFREWLASVGGESEKLPENTFKGSEVFRETGTNTRLVTIHKASPVASEAPPQPEPTVAASTPPEAEQRPIPAALKKEEAKSPAAKESAPVNPAIAKEQKKFLLSEVAKAISEAPETLPTVEADADLKLFEANVNLLSDRENRKAEILQPLFDKYGTTKKEALDRAIKMARLSQLPKVTFAVPGDGTFDVVNHKATLKDFESRAKKFPLAAPAADVPTQAPTPKPAAIPKAQTPKTAGEIVKALAAFVSPDETRGIIQYVFSNGENVAATNGRGLFWHDGDAGGTEENPVFYNAKGSKVDLKDVKTINWKQFIPNQNDTVQVAKDIDTGRLFQTLTQAKALSKPLPGESAPTKKERALSKNPDAVHVMLNPDKTLGFEASSQDGEYMHNVQPQSVPMAAFGIDYLIDAMETFRQLGHDKVSVYLDRKAGDLSPMLMEAPGTKFVLMPIRSEKATDWTKAMALLKSPGKLSAPAVSDLTPEAAGFDSEREARQAFEREAIKDVGETYQEFLQRMHCHGLTRL